MELLMQWMMFLAFIAGLVLPVVAVVGVVLWIRGNRRHEEVLADGSPVTAVLDGLDQVQLRLDALSDRLARLEESQRRLEAAASQEAPPAGDAHRLAPLNGDT